MGRLCAREGLLGGLGFRGCIVTTFACTLFASNGWWEQASGGSVRYIQSVEGSQASSEPLSARAPSEPLSVRASHVRVTQSEDVSFLSMSGNSTGI